MAPRPTFAALAIQPVRNEANVHPSRIVRHCIALVIPLVGLVACAPPAVPVAVLEAPPTPPPPHGPIGEPNAPPAPPPELDATAFLGCWVEDVDGRHGCDDTVNVSGTASSLVVTSEDCNDGAAYVTARAAIQGGLLDLELVVPSNGTRIEYTLRPGKRGSLEGKIKVTIGEGVSHVPVVWRRCEAKGG